MESYEYYFQIVANVGCYLLFVAVCLQFWTFLCIKFFGGKSDEKK